MHNFCPFCKKKHVFFLFYTPIFTKHSYQFVYFAHLFNKIFILDSIPSHHQRLEQRRSSTQPPSLTHTITIIKPTSIINPPIKIPKLLIKIIKTHYQNPLIISRQWHDGLHCPTQDGIPSGMA